MGEDIDQSRAPILEAIKQYHARHTLPFTTPGHKMGQSIDEETRLALGADTFFNDIPEIEGMDDRHMSKGVLTQAEQLAAKAYGADQAMFSVDGSSLSAHSSLLAVAGDGETVLFAR